MPNPWTFLLGAAVGLCAAVYWVIAQDNRQSNPNSRSRPRDTPQEREFRGWDDDDSGSSGQKSSSSVPQEGHRRRNYRARNPPSCAICMETFTDLVNGGRNLCSLSCGHIFCEKCIRRTLEGSKTCPKCRKDANVDELQYVYL